MDWLHLIEYEFLMTFFWVIFVFIPLPILIYGDLDLFQIDKKQIIMFLVMFFIRIILLVLSFNIVEDDSRVFMVDFVLLVVFAVVIFLINTGLKGYYGKSKTDTSKDERNNKTIDNVEIGDEVGKTKAISKDESKIRVLRSKVISNQKEYLKDKYNLGGSEKNGANNDEGYSNRVTISNHSDEGVYMNRNADTTAKEICTYCGEEVKSDFIYCPVCGKPIVSKMIQDTDGFK